ncbi:hypothetical protein LP316_03670 [Thalassotalea sp. LPB0316]|uniref:hypothetical protein n=1 Tax=Thalassotalea sp. LPB0316 TaxID=2769490 RepID=UPI00186937CC|nr:hypothetical protein [Thalassotalea sp. LPB0316]QOL26417.1 hypothetical protein LP316_03670 [Thalassotalea sp. LPB0316]
MNQAILLNDDLKFNGESWQLTGLASGQLITITVFTEQSDYSDSLKFDIEMAIEDWLEDNEPDEFSSIELTL